MNFYRVEYGFTRRREELVGREWVGTRAAADQRKKELMQGSAYDIDIQSVEVPTDKPGLLAWLNDHLGGDPYE